MKRLVQRKGFRVAVRMLVGGMSLLALAWAAYNWSGARAKSAALESAREAGLPLTLEEFARDMPPEDGNAARRGLLREWEEAFARGGYRPGESPSSPMGIYESLGDDVFRTARKFVKRGLPRQIDFSQLPADGPYGRTEGSFLAEYERRNGDAIARLMKEFALPDARRPMVPADFGGGVEFMTLSEAFGLASRKICDGLVLRAEAALRTGDSRMAAESVELGLRIAGMVGSKGWVVSMLVQFADVRLMNEPLKNGIVRNQWTTADLIRIERALERFDIREGSLRAVRSELLGIHAWQAWKDDRRLYRNMSGVVANQDDPGFLRWFYGRGSRLLPAGWFDRNATAIVEATMVCSKPFEDGEAPAVWWSEGTRIRQESERRGRASAASAMGSAVILQRAAHATVELGLMRTACALEKHRLETGAYPATLDAIPTEIATDPMTGDPFRYRITRDAFLLYSVGPDGVDDGGETESWLSIDRRKDWVW